MDAEWLMSTHVRIHRTVPGPRWRARRSNGAPDTLDHQAAELEQSGRAATSRPCAITSGAHIAVGHYIAEGGNDFWGRSRCAPASVCSTTRIRDRGRHNEKRPLLLMSDRDSGLWIFRYTGKE
jgi:hypothetical protein